MRRLLLVGAFSCHFALVVAGALHLTARLHGPVERGLRFYDELSGAGDSYSFFAPAVGPQLRARFTLSTPRGERSEETLEAGKSREVGFRVGNLAGTIYIAAKRADLRARSSVRSQRVDSAHIRKRAACRWTSRIG